VGATTRPPFPRGWAGETDARCGARRGRDLPAVARRVRRRAAPLRQRLVPARQSAPSALGRRDRQRRSRQPTRGHMVGHCARTARLANYPSCRNLDLGADVRDQVTGVGSKKLARVLADTLSSSDRTGRSSAMWPDVPTSPPTAHSAPASSRRQAASWVPLATHVGARTRFIAQGRRIHADHAGQMGSLSLRCALLVLGRGALPRPAGVRRPKIACGFRPG
jgi:hypothetical protein